jgi:hypothetical protein
MSCLRIPNQKNIYKTGRKGQWERNVYVGEELEVVILVRLIVDFRIY